MGLTKIIVKNSFKFSFCIFFLVVLSGCFDKPIVENGSNSTSSQPGTLGSSSSDSESSSSQDTTSIDFNESFFIKPSKKLDILVVLHGESEEEKGRLGLGLSRLLVGTEFQSIDWQVAFISEDPSQNNHNDRPTFLSLKNQDGNIKNPEDNKPIYILDPELQDDHIITELVIETMMSSSGNQVQPLVSLIQSIGKSQNQSFFREDAFLAAVVLSKGQDEEENTPPLGVTASIQHHLGSSKSFTTYGFITEVGDTECAEAQTNSVTNFSYAVSALIDAVEGISNNICEEDYTSFMTQIETDLKNKLEVDSGKIKLQYSNIVEDRISLSFNPEENAQSWQFNSEESEIVFDEDLLDGTTVEVSYSYLTEDSSD